MQVRRCYLTACGWASALGTVNVVAETWQMTRSQTLKTQVGVSEPREEQR